MSTREDYINYLRRQIAEHGRLTQILKNKRERIAFISEAIPLMNKEVKALGDSKLYDNDEDNGIMVNKIVQKDHNGSIQSQFIEITVDLSKHSDKEGYAKKIAEICSKPSFLATDAK